MTEPPDYSLNKKRKCDRERVRKYRQRICAQKVVDALASNADTETIERHVTRNESWVTRYSNVVEKKWGSKCVIHRAVLDAEVDVVLKTYFVAKDSMVEKSALRQLGKHPHILQLAFVHDISSQQKTTLVTKHFDHEEWSSLLPSFTAGEVQRYMRALIEALRRCHSAGIVHRDVKPLNFLYSRSRQQYLLIDFGESATAINVMELSDRNHAAVIGPTVGTQGYCAPECIAGVSVPTCAEDVWSVGIIVLSLLARKYNIFRERNDWMEIASFCGGTSLKQALTAIHLESRVADTYIFTGNIVGTPSENILALRDYVDRVSNAEGVLGVPDSCFALLLQMLDPNPLTRINMEDAWMHSYFSVGPGKRVVLQKKRR